MMQSTTRPGFKAAIVALAVIAWPIEGFANHDEFNLHIEPALGLPTAGNLAPPSSVDNLGHGGAKLWLAVDYEVSRLFAIEAIGGIGTLIEFDTDEPNFDDKLLYTLGIGGRLRLQHADTGGESSSFRSNFWTSVHVGLIGFAGPQFGVDAAVGYEVPVSKALALGPFVRGELTVGEVFGKTVSSTLFGGISLAIGTRDRGEPPDSDNDGLTDDREIELGTDPKNADTDGDAIADGVEVDTGTDPLDADSDGGGVPDGEEDLNGNGQVDPGETDPRVPDGKEIEEEEPEVVETVVPDTDNDGVNDSEDACPDTPAGVAVDEQGCEIVATTFTLESIQFETRSAEILPEAEATLRRAVAVLKDHPAVSVEIRGHTDSRGTTSFNRELSRDRAKAVRDFLVRAGVDASRLSIRGLGPQQPIGDNATEAGRAKNRRVDFERLDD